MKFLLLMILGITAVLAEESQVLKDFAVGNNQFAANVYRELRKTNSDSFLVCPLSAEIILALVHDGAKGQTAKELSTALHLSENKETVKQIFLELAPRLEGNDKYTLSSANKIYVKDGYKIKDQFKSTAVNVFKADIQPIDFEKNELAASEMNSWVEEKTHHKIKNLINKESLDEHTRAVLINAMYFKGTWVNSFPEDSTIKGHFYVNNNKQIEVDMMQQLNHMEYYESSDLKAQFVKLYYEGNDVTMTIALPNEKDGLLALENRIADVLGERKYLYQLVEMKLPKFKTETTTEFVPILKALGVEESFGNSANFEDILLDEPLKISKIIQKAFIEVEEKGTIASAATAGELMHLTSDDYMPPLIREFNADHPFIYFIKIKDVIFFVGRYAAS